MSARRIAAGILTGATLALGATALPASAMPTPSEADAYYSTHLGPSKAWKKASKKEKHHAKRAYFSFASWSNGCREDLRHAYQGKVSNPKYVQPGLRVDVVEVKGADVLFGRFVEGVCN